MYHTIEEVGTNMYLCVYDDHERQEITTLLCYCQLEAAELCLAADAPEDSCVLLVPALPGSCLASDFCLMHHFSCATMPAYWLPVGISLLVNNMVQLGCLGTI